MDRNIGSENGLAILETSAVIIILLTILLSGWAAIDLFQRGIFLSELIESTYYDGVISAYSLSEDGQTIQINRNGLSQFVEGKLDRLAQEIESLGAEPSDYALEGALLEISWNENAQPIVERVTRIGAHGALAIPASLKDSFDIEHLAQKYLVQLVQDGATRTSVLRPDVWQGAANRSSFVSNSFALLGTSAALSVNNGLAKILLDGAGEESILVRSSFNSVRRDL